MATNEAPTNDLHDDPLTSAQPAEAPKKRFRKPEDMKEKKDGRSHTKNQPSLDKFTRPSVQHVDQVAVPDVAETTLEEDPNLDRKKRRKTESPDPPSALVTSIPNLGLHQQPQAEAHMQILEDTSATSTEQINSDIQVILPFASSAPVIDAAETGISKELDTTVNQVNEITPKKQIKITKTGKLVSSPPKPTTEESSTTKKRRGRKLAKTTVSPTVTIIKYGSDSTSRLAIGARIEAILASKKSTSKRSTVPKRAPAKPPKVTHPFFTGKAGQKTDDAPVKAVVDQRPPTPRKSAVTPGKLRAEARRDRSPESMPTLGMSLGSSRVTKQSGLYEASWPTRETTHVRNLGAEMAPQREPEVTPAVALHARKMKSRVVTLEENEELISRLAKLLAKDIHVGSREAESDFTPPEDVRLPTRLLTTGIEIQRRVYEQLQSRENIHPAIASLYADIEHTLTPFDQGRCEGQIWAQKYSPKCASHVLHTGEEAMVLKEWLQNLTVMAVGGAQGSMRSDAADIKRPPRKKRKKAFDDFIVSDYEDGEEEMIELKDNEDTLHARSFRQPQWTRNKNVVLISGPNGCGKSATVYAVAKELDFEVFEINSGMRRSGKDIQDKVGDMTANHLVNHKRNEAPIKEEVAPADGVDTDNGCIGTALQKDIDSGRQGTMMTFFKANPITKTKPNVRLEFQETKIASKVQTQAMLPKISASHKSQKQSLILFEEADILFEEDQQFWAQVTKLAAHSKRPIIITCNDERQIPMQDLPLAAVLRLHAPSADLAIDYLLVLAGREGHILERQAVSDLYESKNQDLRASIAELNLWCQMSVGDRKGGLEWMYQRWPPGNDVDSEGRLLRVASEGTYQAGMGWLSHNIFETKTAASFDKEEELLNEVWAGWGISPKDWKTNSVRLPESINDGTLKELERMEMFTDTLSAADVYCRVGLPSYDCDYDQPADPTLPPIVDKARLSYTLAARLLQADQQSDFIRFDTLIYTQTHLLAHRVFPEQISLASASASHRPLTESDYTQSILKLREDKSKKETLTRLDYSYAFDVLATPPDYTMLERTSFNLTPSSFDRTFSIITLDLAPYVRSIVAHEQILETQRIRMSNLLSGGGVGKRPRTTRASRVALEGGVRETKRRDRWFDEELNFELVMATAGKEWTGMGWRNEDEEMRSVTGTQESLASSPDVMMQDIRDEYMSGYDGMYHIT